MEATANINTTAVTNTPAASTAVLTKRSLPRFMLLTICTLGIYPLVFFTRLGNDLNTIAGGHDHQKTMRYYLAFLLSLITGGIAGLVWFHSMSNRVGAELERRNIQVKFGSKTFWGWNILGVLIVVGPFVYIHKLCKAMNLLAESYNRASV